MMDKFEEVFDKEEIGIPCPKWGVTIMNKLKGGRENHESNILRFLFGDSAGFNSNSSKPDSI